MIFRQLFDSTSCTYTYLLARRTGGEALLIDPVIDQVPLYLRLLRELDLKLVKAVDTHLHADHVTGLAAMRDQTDCLTVMGKQTSADVVAIRVQDGDTLRVDGLNLDVIYTPGHTDDSYSFHFHDRVFTGDTLLIRSTGRTDFQNGDARAQYHSLFDRLLRLPEETLIFPAHDYKGETSSTIREERKHNPRLQVSSIEDYVTLMGLLNLPNPKMMDIAVPANQRIGLPQDQPPFQQWALPATTALDAKLYDIVDLRENGPDLPGACRVDYAQLPVFLYTHSNLRPLLFVCAYGEASAQAARQATQHGLNAYFLSGGMQARHATSGV